MIDWLRSRRVQEGRVEIFFACLMIVALYFWLKPKPQKKVPTLEDIRRKYPPRKSQEQIKAEGLKERKAAYDRELANRMKAKGMTRATHHSPTQSVPKRDISISNFRMLIKMVNGQEDVARRLIEGNLKLFPDKSPDWACEKAILDIERDRRI